MPNGLDLANAWVGRTMGDRELESVRHRVRSRHGSVYISVQCGGLARSFNVPDLVFAVKRMVGGFPLNPEDVVGRGLEDCFVWEPTEAGMPGCRARAVRLSALGDAVLYLAELEVRRVSDEVTSAYSDLHNCHVKGENSDG